MAPFAKPARILIAPDLEQATNISRALLDDQDLRSIVCIETRLRELCPRRKEGNGWASQFFCTRLRKLFPNLRRLVLTEKEDDDDTTAGRVKESMLSVQGQQGMVLFMRAFFGKPDFEVVFQ